jgi:predicted O-linked N-acetylglucosamine transferase (SPINDLY family)
MSHNPLEQLAQCMQRLAQTPHDGRLWCEVGFLYLSIHEVQEALDTFLAARQIAPTLSDSYYGEAIARTKLGDTGSALTALRHAMQLAPQDQRLFSAYAYLCQANGEAPAAILAAYADWGKRFAAPLTAKAAKSCGQHPKTGKKIRLGYVSADFRRHALMDFFAPVLAHHDRSRFELFAYFSGREDDSTDGIRQQFNTWRDVRNLDDARLAEQIRQDQIDILIDLSGHSEGTRLLALARRPAPLQLTWYGYNGTTGMRAMDGRLTDPVMDPSGNEAWSVEPLVRLPQFACFAPPDTPPPGPLPSIAKGYVTFGSLNNAQKISRPTLEIWASILRAVPDSRLLLIGPHAPSAGHALASSLLARLAQAGIPAQRVDLLPQQGRDDFLRLGESIDIALEPFPLTGAVTTAQALWMGLPCLTLLGRLPSERAAGAILAAADCPEFAVSHRDDYIEQACRLAAEREQLASTRSGLRQRLRASPLLDHAGFVHRLEEQLFRHYQQSAAGTPC